MNKGALLLIFSALLGCNTVPAKPRIPEVSDYPQCPETIYLGWKDGEVATAEDVKVFKTSLRRCNEIYPGHGCVKRFQRLGPKNYQVICGRP